MLHLITGDNGYGIKTRLKQIKNEFKLANSGAEITQVDASDIDSSKLRSLLSNESLFSPKALVILMHPDDNKEIAEDLAETAKKLPQSTDLIVVSAKPDKRTRWYKALKKLAKHEEINEKTEAELIKWATTRAKELKAELSPADARLLISRAGANQTKLDSEISKLAANSPKIGKQSIELLVDKTPAETIFDLLDSVVRGRTKRAHGMYRELALSGVDAHQFVAMMSWQVHNLVAAKTNSGMSPYRMAAKAGMSPFVAQKALSLAADLNLKQIETMVALALKADVDIKKTRADSEARAKLLIDEIGLAASA